MAPNKVAAVSASAAVLCVALFTNQYFYGGLYGPLHNNSVKPALKASGAHINGNELRFDLTRTAGPDTYGSFLIDVAVVDAKTRTALALIPGHQLGSLSERDITNERVAQVHPGKNSLVVPLGAKAQVTIKLPQANIDPNGRYELALTDISDTTWTTDVKWSTNIDDSVGSISSGLVSGLRRLDSIRPCMWAVPASRAITRHIEVLPRPTINTATLPGQNPAASSPDRLVMLLGPRPRGTRGMPWRRRTAAGVRGAIPA
jgi:hypothetical protein